MIIQREEKQWLSMKHLRLITLFTIIKSLNIPVIEVYLPQPGEFYTGCPPKKFHLVLIIQVVIERFSWDTLY